MQNVYTELLLHYSQDMYTQKLGYRVKVRGKSLESAEQKEVNQRLIYSFVFITDSVKTDLLV